MKSDARSLLRSSTLCDEPTLVRRLVAESGLDLTARTAISARAEALVRAVRTEGKVGLMESFLAEYGLSTSEGVALMCLAEAMLRVPDSTTVDELISDKITPHDWASHLGDSGSILVNASTWGLMLTGRMIDDAGEGIAGTLHSLLRRVGEPVIRRAVAQAMAEMGNQFVLGRTIEEAMKRGAGMEAKGYTYSFDMLGEAARTDADALRYHEAYAEAIKSIAGHANKGDVRDNPGISVKLSALHPRYEVGQRDAMLPVTTERLLELARLAKDAGIGFNIDAEEADRLDLSLDVIEATLRDTSLQRWNGFGIVVQAFGRRAMPALDCLYGLAESYDRRIMVRLVKGAYWDTEIKRAQVMGLADYPVFTRKCHSDISYMAGAVKLLGMRDRIYPQFATHNAHSVSTILQLAGSQRNYEFQRLHGMGESLHDLVRVREGTRCRIYAPVGAHEDLLAYLVRRLLENGANSSFVNQIVDEDVSPEKIAADPIALAEATDFSPNPAIPRPADIFPPRANSRGWDLTDSRDLAQIEAGRASFVSPFEWHATPVSPAYSGRGTPRPIFSPSDPAIQVGTIVEADTDLAGAAILSARDAHSKWQDMGAATRAGILRRAADLYEKNAFEIFALTAREAGKTLLDGVAEIREAVDFLRYYADESERTGDRASRGVVVAISPWNFPLAIFTGQIAAALAAGNAVIAKPAEQTPLIAFRAVQWLIEAGVPAGVLQMIPGDGRVGAALTADSRIDGVCFTGSTEVAKIIDRQLARSAPHAMLIAETGGMNAMIVDSTALIEQAVRDIVRASFQSAGQRCSALRVLYVQEDVKPKLLEMLGGAMDALSLGDPWELSTDVGPVIDGEAYDGITTYLKAARDRGALTKELSTPETGLFVPPAVIEVSGIDDVEREIFGPVLHVASFKAGAINQVLADVNAKGYGLTFGLHTRIDARVQEVIEGIAVGNVYVNRDQIGAVVGSQPFGGHGLSGTGPKAGGPLYLQRFFAEEPGAATPSETEPTTGLETLRSALDGLNGDVWATSHNRIGDLRSQLRGQAAEAMAAAAVLDFGPVDLPGPTGESNQYHLEPKGTVLCLGPDPETLIDQVVQALAAGNSVVACAPGAKSVLKILRKGDLPLAVIDGTVEPGALTGLPVAAVAIRGAEFGPIRVALAAGDGPLIRLIANRIEPTAYVNECTTCIDTTAAGGNASLLSESGG